MEGGENWKERPSDCQVRDIWGSMAAQKERSSQLDRHSLQRQAWGTEPGSAGRAQRASGHDRGRYGTEPITPVDLDQIFSAQTVSEAAEGTTI